MMDIVFQVCHWVAQGSNTQRREPLDDYKITFKHKYLVCFSTHNLRRSYML